jgi:hypothetical protein
MDMPEEDLALVLLKRSSLLTGARCREGCWGAERCNMLREAVIEDVVEPSLDFVPKNESHVNNNHKQQL